MKYFFRIAVLSLSALVAACSGTGDSSEPYEQQYWIGQAYPSGSAYLTPPIETEFDWPEAANITPLVPFEGFAQAKASLDAVLQPTNPSVIEGFAQLSTDCHLERIPTGFPAGELIPGALLSDYFEIGTPDNCALDGNVARYTQNLPYSYSVPVIASIGGKLGSVDFSHAGMPRALFPEEAEKVDAYRQSFRETYFKAFGEAYDPELSNIGEIPTLADATEIVRFIEGPRTLRISQWERITPTQHIYRHVVLDVIIDKKLIEQLEFVRSQGVLG